MISCNNILKLASLYLEAALNVPDWMPKWVKENIHLKKSPEEYVKNITIDDFKENINLETDFPPNTDNYYEFYESCKNEFISLKESLDYYKNLYDNGKIDISEEKFKLINNINNLISELLNNDFEKIIAYNYITVNLAHGQKIRAQSGQKFTSLYVNIKNTLDQEDINRITILPLELVPGFKKYLPIKKEKNNFSVVFSKNPIDILGMSSRGNWTSCQNLFDGRYSNCAIGSAISANIGIIYLTDNKDYKSRGPKMISRSLVKLIYNKENKNKALFIDREYPINFAIDIFKICLQDKTDIPVYTFKDNFPKENFYFDQEFIYDIEEPIDFPYQDTQFKEKSPKNLLFPEDCLSFVSTLEEYVKQGKINQENIEYVLKRALEKVNWMIRQIEYYERKSNNYISLRERYVPFTNVKVSDTDLEKFFIILRENFSNNTYNEIINELKELINERLPQKNAIIFNNYLNGNPQANSVFNYQIKDKE